MLKYVTVKALKPPATALVVFLHGLGDSGSSWAPVGEMLSRTLPHVQFVFPNAPVSPVTLNFGMSMPSWYDIVTLDGINNPDKQDKAGLYQSMGSVQELINSLCSELNIAHSRVVLGGFSQGGAVSLLTAAVGPNKTPFAGFVSLSSYLPLHHSIESLKTERNTSVPIFMAHGTSDNVVQYAYGVQSKLELGKLGFSNVEFREYRGMEHSSCEQEIRDLEKFLQSVIS